MASVESEIRQIAVENPATGETIRTVPVTDPDAVQAMVERARAVQPAAPRCSGAPRSG
jgi:acyl-CoA reductase-like NAD-dependent aldehyde dehydrogenase